MLTLQQLRDHLHTLALVSAHGTNGTQAIQIRVFPQMRPTIKGLPSVLIILTFINDKDSHAEFIPSMSQNMMMTPNLLLMEPRYGPG